MKLYWPRIKYKNDKGAIEDQWTYDSELSAKDCEKVFEIWQGIYLIKEAWIDVTDTEDLTYKKRIEVKLTAIATCGDCISRAEALEILDDFVENGPSSYLRARTDLLELPSVIPEKSHGKWIPIEYDGYADGFPVWDKWECDQCGYEHDGEKDTLDEYCAGCGAEMEIDNE